MTLVRLSSGGFEYSKRDDGRAVVARPTELVLRRGPGSLPGLPTAQFFPDWSSGSFPFICFSDVLPLVCVLASELLWDWALWDEVGTRSRSDTAGRSAPP